MGNTMNTFPDYWLFLSHIFTAQGKNLFRHIIYLIDSDSLKTDVNRHRRWVAKKQNLFELRVFLLKKLFHDM